MKWRDTPTPVPDNGRTRVVRHFAWKPTKVGEFMVWLESYEIRELYFQPAGGNPGWWVEYARDVLDCVA